MGPLVGVSAGRTVAAVVSRVVDGDTIDAHIDLDTRSTIGLALWAHNVGVRLARSNAAEKTQPGGPEARANLAARLPAGTPLSLRVVALDEYRGRIDAEVTLADGTDLIGDLIAQQWLAPWDGHTSPKPVPPWPRTVSSPEGGS